MKIRIGLVVAAGLVMMAAAYAGEALTLNFRGDDALPAGIVIAPGARTPEGLNCTGGRETGTDFCRIPAGLAPFTAWPSGTVTLEMTPQWRPDGAGREVLFCTDAGVLWGLAGSFHLQREGNALRFIVITATGEILRCSAENSVEELMDGRSHTLTATWDTETGLTLYVDGFRRGTLPGKFTLSDRPQDIYVGNSHILGGALENYFPADAVIAAMTISPGARTDIQPEQPVRAVLYPADHGRNGISYLTPGIPTHLLFFYCAGGKRPEKAELVLDLPPGIRIVGYGQTWINQIYPDKPALTREPLPDGGTRCRIAIDHPEAMGDSLMPTYNHMVYLEPDADLPPGSYPAKWRIDCDGQAGTVRPLRLDVLPALQYGALPRDFQLSLFFGGSLTRPQSGGHLMIHPDDEAAVTDKLRTALDRLGVNTGREPGPETLGDFQGYHANFHNDWLTCPEAPRRIGPRGETLDGFPCPDYLGSEGAALLAGKLPELQQHFREKKIRYVLPDYEMERYLFQCFCPACRAAFERFAGVKVEGMTGEQILAAYPDEWAQFLCVQNARMLEQLTRFIRRIDPELKIYLCANYVFDPAYTLKVGHDVRLFEPFVDAHMPMIYYGGADFFRKIDTTCRELKKPVLPHLCANDVVYLPRCFLSPGQMRMNLLAAFACGAKGAAFYPGADSFDAEYYTYLNRTMQEIAALEPYREGTVSRDADLAVTPRVESKLWARGDDRLIALFHYGSAPIVCEVRLTGIAPESSALRLRDLSDGGRQVEFRRDGDALVFHVAIPAGDCRFLVLSDAAPDEVAAPPEWSYEAGERAYRESNVLPAAIRDPEFFDRDGAELIVKTDGRRFRLNIAAGTLVDAPETGEMLFSDCFYTSPGFAESRGRYELTAQPRDAAGLRLELTRDEPEYPGLKLKKELIFPRDGNSVTIRYTVENSGDKALDLRLWVRSIPFGTQGRQTAATGRGPVRLPNNDNLLFRSGREPRIDWEKANRIADTPLEATVTVHCGDREVEFDTADGVWEFVYLWNGHFLTVEMASAPLHLAPGATHSWSTGVRFPAAR